MGAKIPQQSSLRLRLHSLRLLHIRKLLKKGAQNPEANSPIFLRTHIQLAGDDLTNNHTFKLLSGLLQQTLYR
jgi:hypothetical protein